MNDVLKLAGLTEQVEKFNIFAEKRLEGAKKISDTAEEKGGPALLTHYHFAVKLPYYKKAAEGKINLEKSKKEYLIKFMFNLNTWNFELRSRIRAILPAAITFFICLLLCSILLLC